MFDMTIIDSDAFLDLPFSAQALYFHLFARTDEFGFINNPKTVTRAVGATTEDMEALKNASFVAYGKKGAFKVSGKGADIIG